MQKDKLREILASLSTEDRDDIEELIICGPYKARIHQPWLLERLGLISELVTKHCHCWVYSGGPLSQFFELRLEVNFA